MLLTASVGLPEVARARGADEAATLEKESCIMAWLSAPELAAELEVSPSTVRKWAEEGLPAGLSPEGKRIYNVEAVQIWLAEAEEDADDEPEDEEEDADDGEEDDADDE